MRKTIGALMFACLFVAACGGDYDSAESTADLTDETAATDEASEAVVTSADDADALYNGCPNGVVSVKRGKYTGAMCAGQNPLTIQYGDPGNVREVFVIGTPTSNNIFHIWQRYRNDPDWSGWTTVPGFGTGVPTEVWGVGNYIHLISYSSTGIQVYGTDGNYYCNKKSEWKHSTRLRAILG